MSTRMFLGESEFANLYSGDETCLSKSRESILQCLDIVLSKEHNGSDSTMPVTIADFGTADGSVSLEILNAIIEKIRQRKGENKDITLILEDQLTNDFNTMFKVICGSSLFSNVKLRLDNKVFIFASGRSMYKQCIPSGTVDIALSSMSVHWLSKRPCSIQRGLTLEFADEIELSKFQNQATEDWRNFLIHRQKELRSGGYLVVLVRCKPTYQITKAEENRYKILTEAALELLHDQVIEQDEFEQMTIGCYLTRTEADIEAPFIQPDAILGELEIQSIVHKNICLLSGLTSEEEKDFERERIKNYAADIVKIDRLWMYMTIYHSLSEKRSENKKRDIIEEYYQRLYECAFKMEIHPSVRVPFMEVIIVKK